MQMNAVGRIGFVVAVLLGVGWIAGAGSAADAGAVAEQGCAAGSDGDCWRAGAGEQPSHAAC